MDFKGITHVIKNPSGHAPGFNFSLVGSVPTCLLDGRKPTRSDVMGCRVQSDGLAYHGRKWETVRQILNEAAKYPGVQICNLPACARQKLLNEVVK